MRPWEMLSLAALQATGNEVVRIEGAESRTGEALLRVGRFRVELRLRSLEAEMSQGDVRKEFVKATAISARPGGWPARQQNDELAPEAQTVS